MLPDTRPTRLMKRRKDADHAEQSDGEIGYRAAPP